MVLQIEESFLKTATWDVIKKEWVRHNTPEVRGQTSHLLSRICA